MALRIGEVITIKRKEKAWTQEQLANAVGVSAPAVSKWETGATYPDITLLPPIARALNTTVDELLSYQNELSDEDVDRMAKKAWRVYESDGFDAGWSFCQGLFREYPNSIPLKYRLGNLFQSFMLLKQGIGQQEIQACYRRAAELYEEVVSAGHPKYAFHATVILVGCYALLDELDRAEGLLEGLPSPKVEPELMYPSIYALRGKHDEAIRLTQENIRRYISRVSQSLSVLCAYAREREDAETAYALANINFEMAGLFGIKGELAYPDRIKALASRGDKQAALSCLEEYAQRIAEANDDCARNPCFSMLSKQPNDTAYIRKVLAQSVLLDSGYAPLNDEPRYARVLQRLREFADMKTGAFGETDA